MQVRCIYWLGGWGPASLCGKGDTAHFRINVQSTYSTRASPVNASVNTAYGRTLRVRESGLVLCGENGYRERKGELEMSKRVIFISIVVLAVSSVASAGVWNWLLVWPWQSETSSSQHQGLHAKGRQLGIQAGPGISSDTNAGSISMTQTKVTPSGAGTQSVSVAGAQSTYISGSPGSIGVTYQQTTVSTRQNQQF